MGWTQVRDRVKTMCCVAFLASVFSFELAAQTTCPFAVTGNATPTLLKDGAVLLRYSLGIGDNALTTNLGFTIPAAAVVRQNITSNLPQLDLDGDGSFTANDAILIARHLAGYSQSALAQNLSFAPTSTRSGGTSIANYIAAGCPLVPKFTEEFSGPYANWKNVKDYGAFGNGIADDTAAIQAALNDLRNVLTNTWTTLYFPAGTYRITAQLTTSRSAHNDYLGAQLIGEDPLTTTLAWDGAVGGTMLLWDAWFDKVSRIGFDGKSKAARALLRRGSFATYGELSDMHFKDVTEVCMYLSDNVGAGIAEQAVLRNRFYRCGQGITLYNYNTLDIYVWNNYFEDNDVAIYTATGAYQAYENRFVRSRTADMRFGSNQTSSVVNNTSLGSASFIVGDGIAHVQGNKVYAVGGTAVGGPGPLVLLDNVFQQPPSGSTIAIGDSSASNLISGNTFIGSNMWPVRGPQYPFNHGQGASVVIGHPIGHSVDGIASTFAVLGMFRYEAGVQWNAPFGTNKRATRYAITSGDLGSQPVPKDFALYGSNNWGQTWTLLDTQVNQSFPTPGSGGGNVRREYTIGSPGNYSLYELRITKNSNNQITGSGGFVTIAEFELFEATGGNFVGTTNSFVQGADEDWGIQFMDTQTIVSTNSATIPSALIPWDYTPKTARPVFIPNALTGSAIQAAIDTAAAQPAGSRPTVYLKKGSYLVSTTITVPANVELSIVGDGASDNGTRLNWIGTVGSGPTMLLAGPSRATLRDLTVQGNGGNSSQQANALVIANADQSGGRIYGNQVKATGNGGGSYADPAYDIQGVEESDVLIAAFGMESFLSGVRVSGGPVRAGGGSTSGRVDFLTGGTSGGVRAYETRQGGRLAAAGVWYEGTPTANAPYVELTSASGGNLALAAHLVSFIQPTQPFARTTDYAGQLSLFASRFDHRDSTRIAFTGAGGSTRVLGAGLQYALLTDPNPTKPIDQIWLDNTSPNGEIANLAGDYPNYTNKTIGGYPSTAFVQQQLSLLRGIRTTHATAQATGVTDVKLLRVGIVAGNNRAALRITRD